MKEEIVEQKIDHLKPLMKTLKSVDDIKIVPNQTLVSAKADGEMNLLVYDSDSESYTLNKWGRRRTDFPALNEFVIAMSHTNVEKAELMVELYAMEKDHPLKLPQFIHYVKSHNPALISKVHIGIWDLLSVNNQPVKTLPSERYKLAESWLENLRTVKRNPLVHVLPYITPNSTAEIKQFWHEKVVRQGYEGLVIRIADNEIYKIKPVLELDAVIVAVNKVSSYGKPNLYREKQVTSVKLALMRPDRKFVVIGDCASGIDHQLRKTLWTLTENFKVAETDKEVWVKPVAIANIQYTDTFQSTNKVYTYTQNGYTFTEEMKLAKLRHPRLLGFKPNKNVTPTDLRLDQLPTPKKI